MDRSLALFTLSRAGFGANPAALEELQSQGLAVWLDEQLKVRAQPDPELEQRLKAARLHIKYPAGEGFQAIDELRPLACLDAPIAALWHLTDHKNPMHALERRRPRDEVVAATVLRAVHSRYPLRESLCGFWHDHFNVDAGNEAIGVALPAYDRDVIRTHCLGNFREMLEAVAKSAAMQYYLSNRSSRAGSANENFARELFELHTLGRGAYLNDRYDRWREVPGALTGHPSGYIDQDVYEAARAFTGWTIEDGSGIDAHRKLPQSGQFVYVESWHDGYQKRVLATEFDAFAPPLADGRRVLDLVAEHPATARFVCDKLVKRFIGASGGNGLRAKLEQVWREHSESHDQLARVMRALLLSGEFQDGKVRGTKIRRPLNLAAAFARAMRIDLAYAEPLSNELSACGQNLYGWPTPTGLPDDSAPFLTSQALRHRWSLLLALAENNWGTGGIAPPEAFELSQPTTHTAVTTLSTALGNADAAAVAAITANCGWPPDEPLNTHGANEAAHRWSRLAAYCAMAPQFQVS